MSPFSLTDSPDKCGATSSRKKLGGAPQDFAGHVAARPSTFFSCLTMRQLSVRAFRSRIPASSLRSPALTLAITQPSAHQGQYLFVRRTRRHMLWHTHTAAPAWLLRPPWNAARVGAPHVFAARPPHQFQLAHELLCALSVPCSCRRTFSHRVARHSIHRSRRGRLGLCLLYTSPSPRDS